MYTLSNVQIHNARIRYHVACDQFDYELESTLVLMSKQSDYKPKLPTARMVFWYEIIEKMHATGWERLVK